MYLVSRWAVIWAAHGHPYVMISSLTLGLEKVAAILLILLSIYNFEKKIKNYMKSQLPRLYFLYIFFFLWVLPFQFPGWLPYSGDIRLVLDIKLSQFWHGIVETINNIYISVACHTIPADGHWCPTEKVVCWNVAAAVVSQVGYCLPHKVPCFPSLFCPPCHFLEIYN